MNKNIHPLVVLAILVLLLVGVVLAVPTWRQTTLGYLSGETTFEGMPQRYWVGMLQNGSVTERQRAAYALGQISLSNPAAIPLLEAALKDEEYSVRKTAAIALGQVGAAAQRSVPALLEALQDTSDPVRREAATSLGLIHPAAADVVPILLQTAKKDPDAHTRIRALTALASYGPEAESAIPDLVAMMKEPIGQDNSIPQCAMGVLIKIGAKAVPGLVEALANDNPQVRAYATEALGAIGEPARGALPQIKNMLKDSDGYTRGVAALAVWKFEPDQVDLVVPVLLQGLKQKDAWKVRLDSVVILGQIGPAAKQAVPALADMLQDIHDDIRQSAAAALARMGPAAKSALPALEEARQKDPAENVKVAAARAIREINGESSPQKP